MHVLYLFPIFLQTLNLAMSVRTSGSSLMDALKRSRRQVMGLCERENIQCYHGECVENLHERVVRCVCERDYVGPTCEHRCTKTCGNNGRCYLENNEEFCKCSPGFKGPLCDIKIDPSLEVPMIVSPNGKNDFFEAFNLKNVFLNMDSFQRPHSVASMVAQSSVSHCGGGFKCYNYGQCEYGKSPTGNDTYSCKCKPGYLRPFCLRKCDKVCRNGGVCSFEKGTGKTLCLCPWPFYGSDCGEIRQV